MIVYMTIAEPSWIAAYFNEVPALFADHGAVQVAGGRNIIRVEGDIPVPDRMAVFRFPSVPAAQAFLEDPRYRQHRESRQQGSTSQILILESMTSDGSLV